MRDQQNGVVEFVVQIVEQAKDVFSGGGIEIAGRLIAQQNAADERSARGQWPRAGVRLRKARRDGDATGLLAPRARASPGNAGPLRACASPAIAAAERHFRSRERGEKVEGLKNHSHLFAPQAGAPVVVQRGQLNTLQFDRAGGRLIKAANQVEQRRFPGAGRSHHRDPLALFDN